MVPFQALQAFGLAIYPRKKSDDVCCTAIHVLADTQTYSETVGHNFALNATFDEVDASSYDGLWVPGGRAPEYLAHIPGVVELVTKFVSLGKQIASICHGQLILAAAGVVEGRKCTDYMEDYEVKDHFQSLLALGSHVDAVCPSKKAGDTCPTAVHDFEGYDALVIPGGQAPEYLALNESVIALGRKCSAYPAVKLNVVLSGAAWLEPESISRCFTDGNLVTGAAWPGHPEFIAQLMALLGIQVSF
ncbi:Intracellular protease 1 [Glycine soja]|uniref:Intracellular protease 1 n=1 Tax=Glycine soja TaxID=3848 RepID=A0A0B2Q4N9_GLYSO|nr:Intracellular protease 1 [Glycine soja]